MDVVNEKRNDTNWESNWIDEWQAWASRKFKFDTNIWLTEWMLWSQMLN